MSATSNPPSRFPTWILLGGLLLSLVYLPTVAAPFDFIDDGNLVYPVPESTLSGQVRVWWDRVTDNVAHLGPFRPVLHAHWQFQANLFDADPLLWRFARLLWCALAAALMLWLLCELGISPLAALVVTGAAVANPYRGEIWRSLTLQEGVAMPYALLALIAARKAAFSKRPWRWDLLAAFGLLFALGCKNVFAALVPAMLILRSANGFRWRAAVYLLPLAVPAAHFVYFKLNWKPGNYEIAGPSLTQLGRIANGLKGGVATDFLAAGLAAVLACVWWFQRPNSDTTQSAANPLIPRNTGLAALALVLAGSAVYLPLNLDMSGRYTMPAVWGLDILFALVLTRFVSLPDNLRTRLAWAVLGAGLVAVFVASMGRQDKDIARARMLWLVVEHLEKSAAPGERVAWIGGDSLSGELNIEEGIHVAWHLKHRGRADVRLGLFDRASQPVPRVELPPLDGPARFRVTANAPVEPGTWDHSQTFLQPYRLGRKRFECRLEVARPQLGTIRGMPIMPTELPPDGQGFRFDPQTARFMQNAFTNPGGEKAALENLLPKNVQPGDLLMNGFGR